MKNKILGGILIVVGVFIFSALPIDKANDPFGEFTFGIILPTGLIGFGIAAFRNKFA